MSTVARNLAPVARTGAPTWWERTHGDEPGFLVAYFSAEFGVHPSLPIYSGGLGVLAGDHVKSSSDLGVPLAGVGLLYLRGYFRQEVGAEGRQVEDYPPFDRAELPLTREDVQVHVELANDVVECAVWRVDVGRTRLYLLDTDLPSNPPELRSITDTLYGGDREHRMRQELVLGVGGVRALQALGLEPTVFHMNEGHAAFLALERLRQLVAAGVEPREALERIRASTVFTTHTPVPAGNEVFSTELARRYLDPRLEQTGYTWTQLLRLLQLDDRDGFGLTPLALRVSARANAVSQLHGQVARQMWAPLFSPDGDGGGVPIGSVTNGVHAPTWLAPELSELLMGAGVRPAEVPAEANWEAAAGLGDEELWSAHRAAKRRVIATVGEHGASLDPDVLTIGFARRFATYKRGALLLSQPERLARLLDDPERPVQFVFAGKAHPADEAGKDVMQQIVRFAREHTGAPRIHFLPGYDIALAQLLVGGVDLWLNTPRRPLEASGTSGMKAALNGVLNCSILDGWWAEAYDPRLGFAIPGEGAADVGAQDAHDAEDLFRVLEQQVVPAFYEREGELPLRWVAMMKTSIAELGPRFTTARMVAEYVQDWYLPAHRSAAALG
jgi:starch phosphorylase